MIWKQSKNKQKFYLHGLALENSAFVAYNASLYHLLRYLRRIFMGMMDQVKQAMQMRKETKRIQNEIEKITCEYSNGGITAVVRGDFTIVSIKVSEEALQEVLAGKPQRYETMLTNVVNGALKAVKKQTQEAMAKMMQGSGLDGLFGG